MFKIANYYYRIIKTVIKPICAGYKEFMQCRKVQTWKWNNQILPLISNTVVNLTQDVFQLKKGGRVKDKLFYKCDTNINLISKHNLI